jgi:ribosomal protein S20
MKAPRDPIAALIIAHKKPMDEPESDEGEGVSHDEAMKSCAEDFLKAIHDEDPDAVAEAMKDAFSILESMPHEE